MHSPTVLIPLGFGFVWTANFITDFFKPDESWIGFFVALLVLLFLLAVGVWYFQSVEKNSRLSKFFDWIFGVLPVEDGYLRELKRRFSLI